MKSSNLSRHSATSVIPRAAIVFIIGPWRFDARASCWERALNGAGWYGEKGWLVSVCGVGGDASSLRVTSVLSGSRTLLIIICDRPAGEFEHTRRARGLRRVTARASIDSYYMLFCHYRQRGGHYLLLAALISMTSTKIALKTH